MLSAIREIGEWQIQKNKKGLLDVLITEPNFKSGGNVVLIKVDLDHLAFRGIELEDYDNSYKNRYLFRKGPSNGPNPTPSAILPNPKGGKKDDIARTNLLRQIDRTYSAKLLKWFEKKLRSKRFLEDWEIFLGNLKKILSENHEQIIEAICSCIVDLPKKRGKLLSLKIKHEGKWVYIGEFEFFRKCIKDIQREKAADCFSTNRVCSVCGLKKESVSGNSKVFKFYTIDKPGFITGGFESKNAWKNFPVCNDCKFQLEEGRRFIEQNLAFRFCGLPYLLIPKLLLSKASKVPDIYEILMDTKKSVNFKERVKKTIADDTNEIFDLLADEKDVLTLNLLFMRKQQSAERILLFIEDVFPSRINKIFTAKDSVDELTGESFTFGRVRNFFSKSDDKKTNYDLNKYFLEVVDKVFRGITIDFLFLVKFYMKRIRKELTNDKFIPLIKNAMVSTLFFEKLGLVDYVEGNDMRKSVFEEVFALYGKSLGAAEKRGIFLLGVLTQLLLNKQWSERNAKPFLKNLKGLRMDEKDIKGLLPKLQAKLEEYGAFDKAKRLICEEVSRYLLEGGDDWGLSVDEINYYFCCGMNLADSIASIAYAK